MNTSISPKPSYDSFKKMTGPFEIIDMTISVASTIKNTEQNARQK